jgi:Ca2+-binding RTX toxin-like protein
VTLLGGAGFSYKLKIADATVAAGQNMTFDGAQIAADQSLNFDGTANLDGDLGVFGGFGSDLIKGGGGNDYLDGGPSAGQAIDKIYGEGGDDVLLLGGTNGGTMIGGDGNDALSSSLGGKVVAHGDAGDDEIYIRLLTKESRIDGGSGNDTLTLSGDLGLTFNRTTVKNIETLKLVDGDFVITTNDVTVAAGQALAVDASDADSAKFNGSAETDGVFHIVGSRSGDTLTGGDGADTLNGALGADHLDGRGGADSFVYGAVGESTSKSFDVIAGFDASVEHFDLWRSVGGVDAALSHGALSLGTFDTDLANALNAAHLKAGHAVLFTPDSGGLSGKTFLVVDTNGVAGYQASQDLVIELEGAHNLTALTAGNFI